MSKFLMGIFLGVYLGAGLFGGLLIQRSVPALNPAGIAYVAATWPNIIRCARTEADCDPTGPEWLKPYLFSFGEKS